MIYKSNAKALTLLDVNAVLDRPDGRAVIRFVTLERGAILIDVALVSVEQMADALTAAKCEAETDVVRLTKFGPGEEKRQPPENSKAPVLPLGGRTEALAQSKPSGVIGCASPEVIGTGLSD